MKYSMLIFIAVMITSCVEDSWSSDEQKTFSMQCQAEGGSKKYCNCFLENTMEEFPRYEESLDIKFEEAVELSKDCK